MRQLRPYQLEGVERLRESYRRGKSAPLYVLPTGGGKTAVFSEIAAGAQQKGKSVCILVHRQELLLQASRSLDFFEVEHGLIAPQFQPKPSAVQVASVQTLARRLDQYRHAFDLLIIDEAHHAPAKTWRNIIDANRLAKVLGVSATPWRMGGQGLGADAGGLFDDMIVGPSVRWLMDNNYLSPYRLYMPPLAVDLKGIKIVRGDFDQVQLEDAMSRPKITGSAVEHYRQLAKGLPAIAFCVSVRHAELVAAEFRAAGFRSSAISGDAKDYVRRDLIDGLGSGRLDVLTSADLIGEGVDVPVLGAGILLRPTHSLTLHLQQVGRTLRYQQGKTAIILDHVGNTLRHGLPDDEREWSLAGRPKRKKSLIDETVRVKQCPVCFCAHEPRPECPACGHVYEIESPREVDQVSGELREMTASQREALKKVQRLEVQRARTREQLEEIAKQRGYSQGWVWHMLKSRQRRSV